MTTQGPLTDAEDTWVNQDRPGHPYGSGAWVRVGGATRAGLVTFGLKSILGRIVTTAPFDLHVGPGHVGQTYTFKRITSGWSADDARWDTQPTVDATAVTVTVSAQADGSIVSADLMTLLQEVADGGAWEGIQITSDAGSEQLLYSTESGQPAFALTVELSDNPEIPEGLFPDVGAVDQPKVPLGWRAADLDGVTGQAAYRVQYSTTDNGAAPDADTGWLDGALPRHYMTAYAYGFTAGATTGWRANVRDAAGNESGWSDWAHVPYDSTIGALIMDSPVATTFGDPTLRVQAHLAGGESITKFRIRVAKGDDRSEVVYNSRVQNGAADGLIDFELPFRDRKSGRRVFPDDKPRWLEVRAWGTKKRAIREGRGDYEKIWVLLTPDDDLAKEVPAGLTITPLADGDPRHTWEWGLSTAPDAVLIGADDTILARLTSDDYAVASGTYTWIDGGVLAPEIVNDCWVRAVYDGARSAKSNIVTVTPQVLGRWIITEDSDIGAICLAEDGSDSIASADTITVSTKVDGSTYAVTYGPPWISGDFTGVVETLDAYEKLELLRLRASARKSARFIWLTRSVRARIDHMSPMPDAERYLVPDQPRHTASMRITQIED
jgi:hypothetical protein